MESTSSLTRKARRFMKGRNVMYEGICAYTLQLQLTLMSLEKGHILLNVNLVITLFKKGNIIKGHFKTLHSRSNT